MRRLEGLFLTFPKGQIESKSRTASQNSEAVRLFSLYEYGCIGDSFKERLLNNLPQMHRAHAPERGAGLQRDAAARARREGRRGRGGADPPRARPDAAEEQPPVPQVRAQEQARPKVRMQRVQGFTPLHPLHPLGITTTFLMRPRPKQA